MIQFKTYLKSEFGKLKNKCEANKFLHCIPLDVLQRVNLQMEKSDLAERFGSQTSINEFVEQLTDYDLRDLSEHCSTCWRKNNAFSKLNEQGAWAENQITVDRIKLQQAEHELGHLFSSHNYELLAIVNDVELMRTYPYSITPSSDPDFPICLGFVDGPYVRLFDGIHRAILLTRRGHETITVVCRQ